MVPLVALLLAAAPVFDTFDEPLDPARWYIGTGRPPKGGVLKLPKNGWIVSRGLPDDAVKSIEVVWRSRGGVLELAFFGARSPLSKPKQKPRVEKKGKGEQTLALTPADAGFGGTFRLRALRGDVELLEVRVSPRLPPPAGPDEFERRVVHLATTPLLHEDYARVTVSLWDVEVCLLLRRGDSGFELLRAPVKGAPTLAVMATLSDGKALAARAGTRPLAMRDWGDERGNLPPKAYAAYVASEYRVFELMQHAQRALNAALPPSKELDAMVHLAPIRHSANAHAAVSLAETQGGKLALAALRKALGDTDVRRASPDKLRKAAGLAARALLGEAPKPWPGFRFDPSGRYATIEQIKDLSR